MRCSPSASAGVCARAAALRPNAPKRSVYLDAGAQHVSKMLIDVYGHKRVGSIDDRALRGSRALDLGCNVGHSLALAQRGAAVDCVDFSARRLRASEAAWRARKRCTSAWCADSVRFVLSTSADVLSALRNADHAQATHKKTRASPRAAPRYDLVHSAMTLEHLVSPLQTALVQQLCELLAPSGRGWLHLGRDTAHANQQPPRSCDVRGAGAASGPPPPQTAAAPKVRRPPLPGHAAGVRASAAAILASDTSARGTAPDRRPQLPSCASSPPLAALRHEQGASGASLSPLAREAAARWVRDAASLGLADAPHNLTFYHPPPTALRHWWFARSSRDALRPRGLSS